MTTQKLLTVTTRILNLAAHLHAKAVGAHRRVLTARVAQAIKQRQAAFKHYDAMCDAHVNAEMAAEKFDKSLSEPIIVETTIKK